MRRSQFNLIDYGPDRPQFNQKQKNNITKFWLVSLFLFIHPIFSLYYFIFLDKTYNNQNQEGFIICQKRHIRKVGPETRDLW